MKKNKHTPRNGYVGSFHGIPVEEDPNCPTGKMYFLNENFMSFNVSIDNRTKWQKFKDKVKQLWRRLTKNS